MHKIPIGQDLKSYWSETYIYAPLHEERLFLFEPQPIQPVTSWDPSNPLIRLNFFERQEFCNE